MFSLPQTAKDYRSCGRFGPLNLLSRIYNGYRTHKQLSLNSQKIQLVAECWQAQARLLAGRVCAFGVWTSTFERRPALRRSCLLAVLRTYWSLCTCPLISRSRYLGCVDQVGWPKKSLELTGGVIWPKADVSDFIEVMGALLWTFCSTIWACAGLSKLPVRRYTVVLTFSWDIVVTNVTDRETRK